MSCNSCGKQFYGVHERLTPYRFEIKIQKGSEIIIKQKMDSLKGASSGLCNYEGVELNENDKVLCFSDPQCECYYLGIDGKKVTVYAVTVPEKQEAGWLFFKEQLDTSENRVTERIRNFVQAAVR